METIQAKQNNESGIDLADIVHQLLTHLPIIILVGILFALASFLFTRYLITPKYTSTTQIYVLDRTDTDTSAVTYNDLSAGFQLTQDYMELIKSRSVLEDVISALNLDTTPEKLASEISVSNPDNTRILSIDVQDADPKMAKDVANALREAVSIQIVDVMNSDVVNTVEVAGLAEKPSSPNTARNMLIAFFIGLVGSAGVIIVIYLIDDTVKTPDDVERYLGLSVLVSIPISGKKGKSKKYQTDPNWSKTKLERKQ